MTTRAPAALSNPMPDRNEADAGDAQLARTLEQGMRGVPRVAVVAGRETQAALDQVVVEEPLEIQLGSAPVAVVMRTPGRDEELVRGFLLTERVVDAAADIETIRPCVRARSPEAEGNVVRASLRAGVRVDLERLRRNLFASSSCGVCGKATLEQVLAWAPPLTDPARFDAATIVRIGRALGDDQPLFAHTGGLHAAGLFDARGQRLVVREDVGRHNAVDKVIGWAAARGRLPLAGHVLAVSGRVSFEIAQKAAAARIPLVAAVSAPSSLAVELAEAAQIAIVAFLRGERFSVYGARQRLAPAGPRR